MTTMLDETRISVILDTIRQVDALALPGALAEFGTYLGGMARRMSLASPTRRLFVFDTFEGLSEPVREKDGTEYEKGQWRAALSEAVPQLSGLPVTICVGEFPKSAEGISPQIAVAHLDLNLYAPTIAALHYVWERMPVGGWIILDDYGYGPTPGIQQAVQEFGQPVTTLPYQQALIQRQ